VALHAVSERLKASGPPAAARVHIVEAVNGPLAGPGRAWRVAPFATAAVVSTFVAVPAITFVHTFAAIAGITASLVTIVMAVTLPWHRFPRRTQLIPPYSFLGATLLMAYASDGGVGSPFVTMIVMPMAWLALYESRMAVATAAAGGGTGLWLVAAVGHGRPAHVAALVFIVCGTAMGMTLQHLVADARRVAHSLRQHQGALERTAAMLDALPERVNRYRVRDHVITYCNTAWANQYRVDTRAALGRPLDDFLSDDELQGLRAQLAILDGDHRFAVDSTAREVKSSPGQWLEWADLYLPGENPEILSVGRDVTSRREAEARVAASETRFRELADRSADVVWRFVADPTPHFDYLSPSIDTVLGYPPGYFLEDFSRMLDILDVDGRAAIERALRGERVLGRFDFRFRHANGSTVVGETRTTAVPGGLQGVSRDVTELRELQASMTALALRDPLTGLANRRLFDELFEADLARTQRAGQALCVAFIDLDNFKEINDTYGHDAGDAVLREIARRLLTSVRTADTVARIGGDEFVIVYEPNDRNSHSVVQRLDRVLATPIRVSATVLVTVSASIGVAATRTIGFDGAALLAAADKAMYDIKRARHVVSGRLASAAR
jgi:diguanylate cyclase (GGDEF)-like protein/PAS domain S-box-containing protein